MKISEHELQNLVTCAALAATRAGEFIARSRPERIERKSGGDTHASQIVTDVDRRSQEIILETLAPTVARFDLGVLAEEQHDDGLRLSKDYFWSIDPLDGTLPFVESRPGYAVSIALVARDGVPLLGVVLDPVDGVLYQAARGAGIDRNGEPWTAAPDRSSRTLALFSDRSFAATAEYAPFVAGLGRVARDLGLTGVDIRPTAGAVMNACGTLENPLACYVKFPKTRPGGGSLWDFAATACLFHEAGYVVTDIHGGQLDLNRADSTFMNHRGVLFASTTELAARIRALRP